jgi:hypothetical protein
MILSKTMRRLTCLLCLSLILFGGMGCSEEKTPPLSRPPLVGAYYYLWYPGNWREGYINGRLKPQQLPALGQYDSSDPRVIEQHIAWASRYGIDFWAVSWWPDQPESDRIITQGILKAKNIQDIRFCIFYESGGLGLEKDRITFRGETSRKMLSDFKTLAQKYFSHPSYLKIQGRPVVILYLTRTFVGDYEKTLYLLRKEIRKSGFDLFLIGDEIFWYVMRSPHLPPSSRPERKRIRWFDAITAYNLYNWSKTAHMGYGERSTFLSESRDLFLSYRAAGGNKVPLIPAVFPGYNDRGVRLSENHPVIPRQFSPGGEEGGFFREALKRLALPFLDPSLPMVLITSFNEWNEGTQIEPTQTGGATEEDYSPSGREYTQGFLYRGYGERYLTILQETFYSVAGRVQEEGGGNPLSGVKIKVAKGKKVLMETQSDTFGYFRVSRWSLSPDSYVLQAEKAGYHPHSAVVRVEGGKLTTVNILLKPTHIASGQGHRTVER